MRPAQTIVVLAIVLAFGLGIYFYPQLPPQVVSHWSAAGVADGYMSKFWGIFLIPFLILGIPLLMWFLPKIDPLRKNIEEFRGYYKGFIAALTLFLFYVYLLALLWNLGIIFDFVRVLVPAFAVLFYFIGVLLRHAKRNWFIGIRTPWTLSSDEVWAKTHHRGSFLFRASAAVSLLGLIWPDIAIWLLLLPPLLGSTLYLLVYSYLVFRRLGRSN